MKDAPLVTIIGKVELKTGDAMPLSGNSVSVDRFETEVAIYSMIKRPLAAWQRESITESYLQKIKTDKDGNFTFQIPVGEYSLLAFKDGVPQMRRGISKTIKKNIFFIPGYIKVEANSKYFDILIDESTC